MGLIFKTWIEIYVSHNQTQNQAPNYIYTWNYNKKQDTFFEIKNSLKPLVKLEVNYDINYKIQVWVGLLRIGFELSLILEL